MIPSLQSICQAQIIKILEQREFDGRLVNDLCRYVPDILLEPIFSVLSEKGVVTDTALLAFLVPSRLALRIQQARTIRNSTFKQIGLNCPNLVRIDVYFNEFNVCDVFFASFYCSDYAGLVELRSSWELRRSRYSSRLSQTRKYSTRSLPPDYGQRI